MKTILILIFVLAAAAAAFVWFGVFNISASVPHWDITVDAIEVLRDRSIIVHSEEIKVPSIAPDMVPKGASVYNEACLHCHGAPGIPADPFSQGLYPAPANLFSGSIQEEWNDKQLYWIVENGIKLTGMPGFSSTYEKEEIAGVIALVKRLPKMSAQEYQQLTSKSEKQQTQ